MNWSRLSSIAEILSSVAILVTLVFLTVEIHQNTVTLEASSREGVLNGDLQHLYSIVDDPALWLSYSKPELTEEEKVRLFHLLAAMMRIRERDWFQYQSGALDERTWLAYQTGMLGTLSFEQTRKWWDGVAARDFALFDPAFMAEVNRGLADREITGSEATIGVFD